MTHLNFGKGSVWRMSSRYGAVRWKTARQNSWCILGPFCRSIFKLTDRHTPHQGLIYREQTNSGSLNDRVTYLSRLLLRSIRRFVVEYVLYISRASGWSRLILYTENFLRLDYAGKKFPNTESIIFNNIRCNDLNNKHMKDILQ